MSLAEGMLRGLLLAGGLVLPGAGWAWGARWPLPALAAAVLSALAILAGLLGCSALGVTITLGSMAQWLGTVAGAGGLYWWSRRDRVPPASPAIGPGGEWWLVVPALPMLGVAVWRAVVQPLPGTDADFRWDHLARVIVQAGNMDFYPPVSTEGFEHYFWADGIAPLVSGLFTWSYLAAGSTTKAWTAIPVLLQFAGLVALVPALAQRWQPTSRAGWLALALAGGTMLLQFSFNLGQETGLMALGVGGLVFYLGHWEQTRETKLLLPAAACAGLCACAREYGAIFGLVGAGWVLVTERRARSLALFTLVAGALPLGWHLRVWYLTGNPLYAHEVGGLFPVNPVFHAWMQGYVDSYGKVFARVDGWWEIGRLLALTALPAAFGLAAGGLVWRGRPGAAGWGWFVAATLVAWVLSVPFTAGGLFYSMRVLSPLLLLGCAWGGAVLARWVPQRRNLAGLLLGLGLFGTDAALRALTIPQNPYATSPGEWLQAGYSYQDEFAREDEPFVRAAAGRVNGRVLSDSAGLQFLFQRAGRRFVPLWSPDARFLFAADFQGDPVARLRAQGYSHLLLKRAQSSADFLGRYRVLQRMEGKLEFIMANDRYVLFALRDPAPVGGTPP